MSQNLKMLQHPKLIRKAVLILALPEKRTGHIAAIKAHHVALGH
jgi:hypothetical protein